MAELRRLDVFDSPVEEAFDRLTRIAAAHFQVPIALVSLVDTDRQWFKSLVGLAVRETVRDVAFCSHAILGTEPMVIEDAFEDQRFSDNPLVTGDPSIRFYAGAPIVSHAGHALGTVCVIDRKPRTLSAPDRIMLKELAALAMDLLEQRRQGLEIAAARESERQALRQFRLFFENAPLPLYRLDTEGRVLSWNPAAERLLGWSADEVIGKFHSLVPDARRDEFEALKQGMLANPEPVVGMRRVRQKKGGEQIVVSLSVAALQDQQGRIVEFLGVVEDITEREQAADRLLAAEAETRRLQAEMLRVERALSRVDPLTGLGNRRACDEAFSREAARAERGGRLLSIVLFDLDHFKRLNDEAGHNGGDEMLKVFATVLKEKLRAVDVAIRWGGEEFLTLLPEAGLDVARDIANRIRLAFADRTRATGRPMTVSGGTAQRQAGDDLTALVARADAHLYEAKASGRDRVR